MWQFLIALSLRIFIDFVRTPNLPRGNLVLYYYFLQKKFSLVSSVARKQGHDRFEQLLVCLTRHSFFMIGYAKINLC